MALRPGLSIFICYRRTDTGAEAVALSDKLQRRRGFDVFKDVDNIPPGQDWLEVIEGSIAKCDVLLALIGADWVGVAGEAGHLLDENDHVRLEIEAALASKSAVIPILFENAKLPRSDALPESLRPLLRRHDLRIRSSTFNRDLDVLVDQLKVIARTKAAAAAEADERRRLETETGDQRRQELATAAKATAPVAEVRRRQEQAPVAEERRRQEQVPVAEVTAAAAITPPARVVRPAPSTSPAPRPPAEPIAPAPVMRPEIVSRERVPTSMSVRPRRSLSVPLPPVLAVGAVSLLAVSAVAAYLVSGGRIVPTMAPTSGAVASSTVAPIVSPTGTASRTPTRPPTPMISSRPPVGGQVTMTTDFPAQRGAADDTFTFDLEVRNESNQQVTLSFEGSGPPGSTGWRVTGKPANDDLATTAVVDAGGLSAARFTIDPPAAVAVGSYPVTVRALGGPGPVEVTLVVEIVR